MNNADILIRLSYLRGLYWNQKETLDILRDAMAEIQYLRKTARLPDSILDDPHAGVMGWGKGKDE